MHIALDSLYSGKIAAVRGEAVEKLLFETDKNARTLFRIGSLV